MTKRICECGIEFEIDEKKKGRKQKYHSVKCRNKKNTATFRERHKVVIESKTAV